MDRRIIGCSAVLILVLAGLAEAQTSPPAGAVQVPKTGLTRCFGSNGYEVACSDPSAAAGQDGDVRAGARWPSSRFTIGIGAEADCVTDNLTGLMWPSNLDPSPTPMTWVAAIDYALNLSQCGHSDWTLANINELESLTHIGMSPDAAASWLAASGFGTVLPYYWSGTTLDRDPLFAWYVEGAAGAVRYQVKNSLFYALPVREVQPGSSLLPRTGQAVVERGVLWPSPRFTENLNAQQQPDGTVTDHLTGLMWLTDANCMSTNYPAFDQDTAGNSGGQGGFPGDGHVSWWHARDFVLGIDTRFSSCGAGHRGWRLPNRRELMSLAHRGANSPALPSGHPFANVQYGYWTSSPIVPPPGEFQSTRSWAFDAVDGALFQDYPDHAVWPVRGGEEGFVHTISGRVTGAPVSSVITMTLGGDAFDTTTTDAGGTYRFTDLANGTYTVWAGLNGYQFEAGSPTVTVLNGDVELNFTGWTFPTYSITGRITDAQSGSGLRGVAVALAGPADRVASTAFDGGYSFVGVPEGSYTISPSLEGYLVVPLVPNVLVEGGDLEQNFSAIPFRITVPSTQVVNNVTIVPLPPTSTPPPGVIFPFGAISYRVTLALGETSSSATMTITPHLAPNLTLFKADGEGAVLEEIPECDELGGLVEDCWTRQDTTTSTIIVLILRDNGPFDLNTVDDLVIDDPVVIGYVTNRPPTADAGTNQTVAATSAAGATVVLAGSGVDPDGDPLAFAWSGPCGSASTASATLTCPPGTSTMTLTVSDSSGLSAAASVQITVLHDTTPPQIACAAPDTAWHAADVTIACSASDADSGLANAADASFALSTNVPARTEKADATTDTRTVCDVADNCVSAGPIGPIKVDRKGPAITIGAPTDGASYILNQVAAAAFSCADGGSGMATCAGTTANGASLDTSSVGTKPFTVTATDAVGNTSSVTQPYRVMFATDGLCEGAVGHAILEPITRDGAAVLKQGRTVPAKFRVCDANGQSVGAPGVVSSLKLVQVVAGTIAQDANVDVPSTTPDAAFRWDPLEQQWIFNISTNGYLAGRTYYFRISLGDGSTIDFRFGLR